MEKRELNSSNIKSAMHDGNDMFLHFHKGAVYQYSDVPYHVFEQLCEAESSGKYFHQFVKNVYTARAVPREELGTVP